jgi:hypothetical protein
MNKPRLSPIKDSIARISREDLTPGNLYNLFRSGAKAVILENDDRVLPLWRDLLGSESSSEAKLDSGEVLPWKGSFLDMAKNHLAKKDVGSHLGDMLFYNQGHLAYIARKFNLYNDSDNNKLRTVPEFFYKEGDQFNIPDPILNTIWDLGEDIYKSALPADAERPAYGMSIERLKYEDCYTDTEKMITLLKNSTDIWSRLGRKVDDRKAKAAGPFERRYVRDLYGLLCQIPGIRVFVNWLNEVFRSYTRKDSIADNEEVVGISHTDGRLITCLSSSRTSIKTEIYDGKKWREIPLVRDSLVIFPGRGMEKYGVDPLWHRILNLTDAPTGPNKSLIYGLRPIK